MSCLFHSAKGSRERDVGFLQTWPVDKQGWGDLSVQAEWMHWTLKGMKPRDKEPGPQNLAPWYSSPFGAHFSPTVWVSF